MYYYYWQKLEATWFQKLLKLIQVVKRLVTLKNYRYRTIIKIIIHVVDIYHSCIFYLFIYLRFFEKKIIHWYMDCIIQFWTKRQCAWTQTTECSRSELQFYNIKDCNSEKEKKCSYNSCIFCTFVLTIYV